VSEHSLEPIDLFARPCRSLHLLRRLRAGELSAEQAKNEQNHLTSCSSCQSRMAQLDAEDRTVREVLPFTRFAEGVARRAAAASDSGSNVVGILNAKWRRRVPMIGLALAACLALAVVTPTLFRKPTRTKGGSDLELFVGGPGSSHRVALGEAQLQKGDGVMLEYDAGDHRYVAVLSIDEQGQVTPLFPQQGASLQAERGGPQKLPQSVVFDGAGRERLVAIFSDSPLQMDELVQTAKSQFARAGSLQALPTLGVGDEEVDRTVVKPTP
jgi:hypothetical protein